MISTHHHIVKRKYLEKSIPILQKAAAKEQKITTNQSWS